MASGTITVSNFSEKSMNVQILAGGMSGDMVASGTLPVGQTSGYLVSGAEQYQVNFFTTDLSGNVTASNVAPDSTVGIQISGD